MGDDHADLVGSTFGFKAHPQRPALLGEMHARPFHLIETPRIILHLAFATPPEAAASDRAAFERLCRSCGVPGPGAEIKHHQLTLLGGTLRWEQHTEYTTYTFDAAPGSGRLPEHPFGSGFVQPGLLVAAVRVDVLPMPDLLDVGLEPFDPISLCVSRMAGGEAIVATDFRQDADGFTRIRVFGDDLAPTRAGALVQRLIEIETYRTFALLGLPQAQKLDPSVRRMEGELVEISAAMRVAHGLDDNQVLLERLSRLAAEIEAEAAVSAYRFAATRAYNEIVNERLASVQEERLPGYGSWQGFLQRRFGPAMRTCKAIEDRQASLATRIARAANLLRTRVDVELEQQNRDLLHSMNLRARLQLRLQQTVEGLSVAAITYYVVALIGKVAEGAHEAGFPLDPAIASAIAVPPVIVVLWLLVQRVRHKHAE